MRSDGLVDIGADEYVDSDGDGMQDYWKLEWFGNLFRNGAGDMDGDTLTDLEEYQYDSDPEERSVVYVDAFSSGFEGRNRCSSF